MDEVIQNNNIEITVVDYLVASLLFATGGNGLITNFQWYAFIIVAIMWIICKQKKVVLHTNKLRNFLFLFILLVFLQIVFLPKVSSPAYFNFSAKIIAGFLMVSFLGDKFRMAYFRVCACMCAISLCFWVIHLYIPFSFGFDVGSSKSLVVWAYRLGNHVRNQGMFWEPGAFQGYIMIVPILFIDSLKELWIFEKKRCIIIITALASTMSTTGYVVFMFLVAMYLLKGIKSFLSKLFLISIFGVGIFYGINEFDFLGEKIMGQYENSIDLDMNKSGDMQSRMGTQVIDQKIIEKHPIIGNSFDMETKYGIYSSVMKNSGNGLTGLIVTVGIPFFLFFLYCQYNAHPSKQRYYKLVAIVSMCMVFYGENFYNFIPYWSLIFARYNREDYLIYQ